MIYEGTVQYTIMSDGSEKTKKDSYLIDNCNTFGQAEEILLVSNEALKDIDVIAIKRSKLKEIVNSPKDDYDKIFIADVMDIYTDENGEEKELTYKVAGFAKDIKAAHELMDKYLSQGFDMQLVGLKMTRIVDVLNV